MTACEFCGETIPADARFCPYCGNSRPAENAAPDGEEHPADEPSGEETADTIEDAAEDDGWRPYRYQRRARKTRVNRRARQPDRRTLRLLAGWLAALIVIAGGIFWYIWSENEPAAQPQSAARPAVITAEQR